MMYNRYIPDADGRYRRRIVPEPAPVPAEEPAEAEQPAPAGNGLPPVRMQPGLPFPQLDSGDLLVLLILLLLFVDSDDSCGLTPLVAIAAFILMQ